MFSFFKETQFLSLYVNQWFWVSELDFYLQALFSSSSEWRCNLFSSATVSPFFGLILVVSFQLLVEVWLLFIQSVWDSVKWS